MMISGAASLPAAGGPEGAGLPDLDRLRVALRPAELPLPSPRDVREAAHRVSDLLHAERYREARILVERFRTAPAPPTARLALLRAALHGAALAAHGDQVDRDAADLVALLRRAGCAQQAEAMVTVLLERGPFEQHAALRPRTDPAGTGRGRRRGQAPQASPEMLVVVRALERTALPGPRGAAVDPRRDAARLRAALAALPAVRDELLTDPEPELRLRFAQALEGAGDTAAATTAALDALELLETARAAGVAAPGDDLPGAPGPAGDLSGGRPRELSDAPDRLATAAHAVLARTLCTQRPLHAVHHALLALEAMPEVEDPPLRIGLITALLQALMAVGATAHATFTAGRLLSLQRTLERDELRIAPLLAVAAQRLRAERCEAAWAPLEQARTIASAHRDRHALLEVARLAASLHERSGDAAASLRELRGLAYQARWLADDLATPVTAQGELIRTELEAHALAMRRALDLGHMAAVTEAVEAIERRTRPGGGRPLLPEELLWDHLVDARVGLFIAVGSGIGSGEEGADHHAYEQRRREAMEAIDAMPAGHEERARYWAAYLDDRHAHLLAGSGRHGAARRAARRAREGWAHLGLAEDSARLDALLDALDAPEAGEGLPADG